MITDIDGIEVGNWSDIEAKTGCTVILFPEGTTTNGKYVIEFKKGAFLPKMAIKIYAI